MTPVALAVAHELVELSHELAEAVVRSDRGRLDALLADEFTLNGAAGVLDRKGFLEAAAGTYEIEEFAYEEIDPEVYGDTGVCVSRYRQEARFGDRDLSGTMHVTDIWVRRESRWQIVRRHATPVD